MIPIAFFMIPKSYTKINVESVLESAGIFKSNNSSQSVEYEYALVYCPRNCIDYIRSDFDFGLKFLKFFEG